jgi:hypothetical protein
MKRNNIISKLLLLLAFLSFAFILGCSSNYVFEESDSCKTNNDCNSGVCSIMKKDNGVCMDSKCKEGQFSIGVSGWTEKYCDEKSKWRQTRKLGEKCTLDYECSAPTGKDCPTCNIEDMKYYCKQGICAADRQATYCDMQGLRTLISKDEFSFHYGECQPTMEQRALKTICSDCGNRICEHDQESICNCPDDCEKDCLMEGEESRNPEARCCNGKEKVPFFMQGNVDCTIVNVTGGICINCGDKKCGIGETTCNCPRDCRQVS